MSFRFVLVCFLTAHHCKPGILKGVEMDKGRKLRGKVGVGTEHFLTSCQLIRSHILRTRNLCVFPIYRLVN